MNAAGIMASDAFAALTVVAFLLMRRSSRVSRRDGAFFGSSSYSR
jgi:hypothetical protein